MRCYVYVIVVLLLACWWSSVHASTGRQKRYLVYPPNGSKTQLIIAVGLPLAFGVYSLTTGFRFKYNYVVPTNSSYYLQPYVTYQKREAGCSTISRWDVYRVIESLVDRLGMDGHACVLRSVCEAAWSPIGVESGYAGEVLHVLLTPSSTQEDCEQWDREYMSAEHVGSLRGERNCAQMYPECPVSLLQMVTQHDEDLTPQQVGRFFGG